MNQDIVDKILVNPIVPVYYNADAELSKAILKACYDGGIRVFEFTNRGEKALEVFEQLVPFAKENCPGLILGIGTIYDVETAQKYIDLGVDFIVQPCTSPEVGEICQRNGIAWIPGVMTPTEINNATKLGAGCVKIFPGNVVGSGYVKALRGPMPHVKIMVTGGVEPTEASLKEWFGAGVNAVGIGSQLFKNTEDLSKLTSQVKALIKIVKS
ncbi:bifunctional 4-hydroxy-2-oxoglutarate aldolase/2-dehydro-3-deoxy-phosphogluconate aldolase [Emticicia sp. CRIBPO]|uniref:bifunctional 4-hydroxy-2-oxoglutarate aldolase/2-dehydro-3-deoxy-phosphogluconate aldolase n=1 Tax=Emticicia sp. CRIBPO TaxID=2683258 RepID=UPI0014120042|nr:bifunctional 4-hydroxy-2-oxoglutarate aldolase/2-dehydro-3-deoxy-phosphogluconate aldolase [Emticicia sp. CRIBPO]NBA88403.1 bifunctional 4-hydroxy-2-oxoglutarate aldolase/2-dehydro-3-deoxy-phosphogluconate aldolase [Emticicia sp. CRIBPO]